MINWLDQKYILLISSRLDRFKKVGNGYNFRCPYCGDSKKSKYKARGWIFSSREDSSTRYFCHNCSESSKFPWFLKFIDNALYLEYITEKFSESNEVKKQPSHVLAEKMKVPKFRKESALSKLKKISALPVDHPAKIYISSRRIPTIYHHKLYYTSKFKKWVNSIVPNKFKDLNFDEPRLVIPMLNENKELIGFQGRSFRKKSNTKYITIMIDENAPKLYGLEDIDKTEQVIALEGPIDSMFIPNSVASCGGKIETNLSKANIKDCCVAYDNEPRSKETIHKMKSSIDAGYSICIWPDNLEENDVNNMILSGYDPISIINSNTYTGLYAYTRLSEWKKI